MRGSLSVLSCRQYVYGDPSEKKTYPCRTPVVRINCDTKYNKKLVWEKLPETNCIMSHNREIYRIASDQWETLRDTHLRSVLSRLW